MQFFVVLFILSNLIRDANGANLDLEDFVIEKRIVPMFESSVPVQSLLSVIL